MYKKSCIWEGWISDSSKGVRIRGRSLNHVQKRGIKAIFEYYMLQAFFFHSGPRYSVAIMGRIKSIYLGGNKNLWKSNMYKYIDIKINSFNLK